MKTITNSLIYSTFQQIFGYTPALAVRAPGRINLIGEHTDYNGGFVLPAAIDKAIYFAIAKRQDRICTVHSIDLNDSYSFDLDNIHKSDKSWANFIVGITSEIITDGHTLDTGFEVVFGGDIPLGAGLSSSAAVESGMCFAISELYNFNITKMNMALLAQRAEHHFAGVKCGIMDMFASIHGRQNSVIQLDCRDLSFTYFPFYFSDYQIVLCNTGVKHSLADSAYNRRRESCEAGIEILQKHWSHIKTLRDITVYQLELYKDLLPAEVYQRCRYVVGEIARVPKACQALEANDLVTFGQYMYETHAGLSQDYEVSCKELDFLVQKSQTFSLQNPHTVVGARMMGGGFGGCTINLVKKNAVDSFTSYISQQYYDTFGVALVSYQVTLADGVSLF
jgi:galactokinase